MDPSRYRDMLARARKNLKLHKKDQLSHAENVTGIEDSLKGKYFDQILELNKHVYTTGSTNSPGTGFQAFWIDFYAPLAVCDFVISRLDQISYSYVYRDSSDSLRLQYEDILALHLVREDEGEHLLGLKVQRLAGDDFNGTLLSEQLPLTTRENYSDIVPYLGFVTIDDAISRRDTLYQVLLDILR